MRPVHVAHVVHSLDPGGAERRLLALVGALDRTRFEPSIVCLDALGSLADEARALGVELRVLERSGRADVRPVARLARLLREERVSVVHGWLSLPSVVARLAAVPARVPVRIAAEGGVRSTTSRWRLRAYGTVDRLLDPITDAYVANSRAVAGALRERGVPERKIVVVPNGVASPPPLEPAERDALRRGLGAREGETLVGMTARIDPRFKDHPTFLRAVAALRGQGRDVRAIVIGDGPGLDGVVRLARDLGLETATTTTGFRRDAQALVGALDVSVLLSFSEGFSNVVLETMAAGVPLVATAIEPNREAVDDGVEGLLVPVGDVDATAAAIARLLDEPGLAEALAHAARDRVAARYSLAAQAERTAELYDRLLAGRG